MLKINGCLLSVLLFTTTVCLCSLQICVANTVSRTNSSSLPKIEQITQPLEHSEGPYWDTEKQALFFVDIPGQKVYRYDPASKQLTFALIGDSVSVIIPMLGRKHRFIIGKGRELAMLKWTGQNTTSPLIQTFTSVDQDKPGNRFNDGKADAIGRLWIGTMGLEKPVGTVAPNRGTLYRMANHSCQLDPMLKGVSISNGIAWSLDNRQMYYIDTPTRRVEVFDYSILSATLSNRRTLFDFEKENVRGQPDGMTVDANGNLWIACWGGSQIISVNGYTGELLSSVRLPVERVTSVTFGGLHYDTLYVTSMRTGLTNSQLRYQPGAGAVFSITNLPSRGEYNVPVEDCVHISN